MCYFYTCIYRVRLPILFFINFRAYCSLFVYIFCFVSHILAIIVVVIMCGVCNIYFVANRIYVEIKYFDIVFYYNMNENRQIVRDNTHTPSIALHENNGQTASMAVCIARKKHQMRIQFVRTSLYYLSNFLLYVNTNRHFYAICVPYGLNRLYVVK